MDEILAVVNDLDEMINTATFSEVHKLGLLHREVYVYIVNSLNQVLLQKRSDNGLWDASASGHFSPNESYVDGALREVKEELGLTLDVHDLQPVLYERRETTKVNKKNFRFFTVFVVRKDIDSKNLNLDSSEVSDARYFCKDDINSLMVDAQLTGSAMYVLSRLFLVL